MIRPYTEVDFKSIHKMHLESALNYDLPDLSDPRFVVRQVVADEDGVHMGAFIRQTHEAYLFCQRDWMTPKYRYEMIKTVQESVRAEAKQKGVKEVFIWCPSSIEKSFGSRLVELGWERMPWPTFAQEVK